MKERLRVSSIAAIAVALMLVVVAAVGAYVLNGGFDSWGRDDGAPSTSPDDVSPWGLPETSSGSSSDQDTGSGSSSEGTGPGDQSDPPIGGSNGQSTDDITTPPSAPGSGDSGSSSPPDTIDYVYGGLRVNGFYTGSVPVWAGHDPDRGTKVSGSDLQAGTVYAVSVDADVTDYGLQWYKDRAHASPTNTPDQTIPKTVMVLDTTVGMILEIHSDQPISAEDVSVSSVSGKTLVLGDPSAGPWVRSIEQVDPNTVRVFLVYEPYTASSSAGAFQRPISLDSSNGSLEDFNDKDALAAYAPLKIQFNTPGNYVLSFYLAELGTNGSIGEPISPTATIPVSVSAKV